METKQSFDKLGLDVKILKAIADLGWKDPTDIQEKAIPLALEGKDVLMKARTGSGKTGAFAIPAIQKLTYIKEEKKTQEVRCIMVAPSKELSKQIYRNVKELIKYVPSLQCVDIAQCKDINAQKPLLKNKPDIIITTPQRLVENLKARNLIIKESLDILVIDEADLAFKYGCKEDIFKIFDYTPQNFQTLMASATLDNDVANLKRHILNNPVTLEIEESNSPDMTQLNQYYIYAEEEDKFVLLFAFFKFSLIRGRTLIFVNSVDRAYKVHLFFEQIGVKSCVLNSELPAVSRCIILDLFNQGQYNILIASDEQQLLGPSKKYTKRKKDSEFKVSRGIDFQNISHVVNVDFPKDVRSYIHRVGRTARGMNDGNAISFINLHEKPIFQEVEKHFFIEQNGEKLSLINKYGVPMDQLDSARYRTRDAYRCITSIAISEARKKELKQELLKSKKLEAYFEDNPTDLKFLKHDKALHTVKQQPHLKNVPEYIVPQALKTVVERRPSKRALDGNAPHIFRRPSKKAKTNKKPKKRDPLKMK